jgi:hypothetical protein
MRVMKGAEVARIPEFLGGVLGGVSVELFDVRLGDFRGLSSRRSGLRWLLLERRIIYLESWL